MSDLHRGSLDVNEVKNKLFRLYYMPKMGWIRNYAEAYKSAVQKETE